MLAIFGKGEARRVPRWAIWVLGLLGLGLAAAVLLASGSKSDQTGAGSFAESGYPNFDRSNSRFASGPIRATTVSGLDAAWTLPIEAEGSFGGNSASPVVADGIAYLQDMNSDVQAVEVRDGTVLWKKEYGSPTTASNGVTVAGAFVYGATATEAFALDRETGTELWSTSLVRNSGERIAMAPGHHEGLVYVSTVPSEGSGGEVGVLWALDGRTGKKVWSFDTVPRTLWGNPKLNYGGGLLDPPAFDADGSMYVGIGSPGPVPGTPEHPWGSSRPGPNLYTDSIVKLDAETGRVLWHYQVTPHDVCNGDIGSPVLVRAGGRDLVIAGGISGIVVALDRRTGKLVWERPVGRHTGHDDLGLYAMRGELSRLKLPMTIYPGKYGGIYASLAATESTVFVPIVNFGAVLVSQTRQRGAGSIGGELVAIDTATGSIKWKREFPDALFGAPAAVNDLLFAAGAEGTMYAFDGRNGSELWKTSLPGGFNAGITVHGDTVLAPAGIPREENQAPEVVAYRLPG